MGNNNLKSGMEVSCNYPQLCIEFEHGKNEKQAIGTFINGVRYSTSAISSKDGWHAFFGQFLNNKVNADASFATAKVEESHTHARCRVNTVDDIKRLQNWLDKKATYAKKTQYPLQNLTYAKMMSMVFEDYAVAWNAYGIELKNDNVLIKHGKVIPMETLRQFSKLWLAENQMFDKYKNNIDFAIRKWWLVA